jgi:dTDP-4-dehydrorhamnose reductase
VLITGASGLLGRQVLHHFDSAWEVRGLCSSRLRDGLSRCDLTNQNEVHAQFAEFAPDIVIHTAAERRPDVVHKKPEEAAALNVDVTERIARLCKSSGAWLVFISSDYVFDGTSPPYAVHNCPNPLSEYGFQKAAGERITLQECPTSAIVRVPLLFGEAEYLKESAVTALCEELKKGLAKADHSQKRYPTYTKDIARILKRMVEVHCMGKPLHGIYHWQADECLTKYDMVQAIAELKQIDVSSVIADKSVPKFPRPEDNQLDCSRLIQDLSIDPEDFRTSFKVALQASLQSCEGNATMQGAGKLPTPSTPSPLVPLTPKVHTSEPQGADTFKGASDSEHDYQVDRIRVMHTYLPGIVSLWFPQSVWHLHFFVRMGKH